jgi:nitroreductase
MAEHGETWWTRHDLRQLLLCYHVQGTGYEFSVVQRLLAWAKVEDQQAREERMDTFECIRTRRTTRTFLPKELPEDTIHKILEAGRLTPSARNRQPWHLIAIRDKALLQRLAPLCTTGRFIEQASFAVAIVTDPANRWHEIDGARAVQNMELAGWNEGVGTCWIGGLERDQIKELLDIPPHLHLLTVLPFGYPTEPDAPRRRTKKRPEEVFSWDRFGCKDANNTGKGDR